MMGPWATVVSLEGGRRPTALSLFMLEVNRVGTYA